jgi:hypothetical protein
MNHLAAVDLVPLKRNLAEADVVVAQLPTGETRIICVAEPLKVLWLRADSEQQAKDVIARLTNTGPA